MAKKTLNRYYNQTDHSEVYHITMGMLPSSFQCGSLNLVLNGIASKFKLNYFCKAGWEQDWIDTAKVIVCFEFNHKYSGKYNDPVDIPVDLEPATPSAVGSHPDLMCHLHTL